MIRERVLADDSATRWKVVSDLDGVFVSHAGIFQSVGDSPRYRYGLIENGWVQVVEGILDDGSVRFMMSPRGTRHTRALDMSLR